MIGIHNSYIILNYKSPVMCIASRVKLFKKYYNFKMWVTKTIKVLLLMHGFVSFKTNYKNNIILWV